MSTETSRWREFAEAYRLTMRKNWQLPVLLAVIAMAISALIAATNTNNKTNAQNVRLSLVVECQANYNEVNNTRTRLLSEAAEREAHADSEKDQALQDLITAFLKEASKEEVTRLRKILLQKLEAQTQARNNVQAERDANPVPPPPNALCGSAN